MKADPIRIVDAQLAGSRARLADLQRLRPDSPEIVRVEERVGELEAERRALADALPERRELPSG